MSKKYSRVFQLHQARRLCVQALYQLMVNVQDKEQILDSVVEGRSVGSFNRDYLDKCFLGVCQDKEQIELTVKTVLDRELTALTPVESAVLHLAVYEFQHCLETPYKVVINEAIKLSKEFGSADGYKYINGVLDKLAQQLRTIERP